MAASGLVAQASVPPGLVPIARVREAVEATVLPPTSWTVTAGCVVHVAVLAPPPGWVVKARLAAGPIVIVNVLLVAEVSPAAVAVRVVSPILPVISQPAKEATPPVAPSGLVVQASVPPGLVPTASVTASVAAGIRLPPASSTLTAGWVVQATPSVPPPGWVVKASFAGAPIVMAKLALVPVRLGVVDVALSV